MICNSIVKNKQKIKTIKKIMVFLLIWFVLIQNVSLVKAQEAEQLTLSLSPTNQYWWFKPGETKKLSWVVQNTSQWPVFLEYEWQNFELIDDMGTIKLLNNKSELEANNELNLTTIINEEEKNILYPGEQKIIEFDITVIDDKKESSDIKEHYLTLVVRATVDPKAEIKWTEVDSYLRLKNNLTSNVIILVSEERDDQSQLSLITKEDTSEEMVFYRDSFTKIKNENKIKTTSELSLKVKNEGKTSTIVNGMAEIFNVEGNLIAKYLIYPDLVLANGGERRLRWMINNEEISLILPWENQYNWLWGEYTIKVSLNSAHELNSKDAENIFFKVRYYPFFIINIIVGIIIIIILIRIIYKIKQKKQYKQVKKELLSYHHLDENFKSKKG